MGPTKILVVGMDVGFGMSVGCSAVFSTTSVNTNLPLINAEVDEDYRVAEIRERDKKRAPRVGWKNDRPRNGQPWER